MTESEASGVGDVTPPYMIFVVVFLFFLTGLFGFLICHLLKKKGYRCRTGDMGDEEEEEEKLGGDEDEDDDNQDTVEQILKCIIENEANMEAFNEMLGNHNVCVRHDSRLRKESIGGIPSHHHTVHSGTDHNSCLLCAQVRSKKGRRQSRTPRSKQRSGEQTVFSVGRFRVTHHDKKLHGGSSTIISSGDHLDQSQDSVEQKEGGYNLRSMFKDVQPPSESSTGVVSSVGKRRRSLTFFGLRRGSDPAGVKVGELLAREAGGFRSNTKQQLVTVEEQLPTEHTKTTSESGGKPETQLPELETQPPVSPETGSLNSSSSKRKLQDKDSISGNEDCSKDGSSPEPPTNPIGNLPTGRSKASTSTSFFIPASGEAFEVMARARGVEDKVLKDTDFHSTEVSQNFEPSLGFTSVIQTDQPEPSRCFSVTQTPPDPSSSSDVEPGVDNRLASINIGSSPVSSVFLLTTPTTPVSGVPSHDSSRNMPSEAAKAALTFKGSTIHSPAGSLLETEPVPLQPPSSSPADYNRSIGSSPPETSVSFIGKGEKGSNPSPVKEQGGAKIPQREESEKLKRPGILKRSLSPVGSGSKTSTSQPSENTLSNLPLSPLSLPSHSSPSGSRKSYVTIMKASPDSRREFSVVTMVEEERKASELGSENSVSSPANVQETNRCASQVEQPEGFTRGESNSEPREG
ncbi:RELT-like protein 2 [Antennarius striatus]|uniref:RELT-like protein 2 n=1 Tax=Antennarius striatus TaxID=241820 RepID=UPI0035B39754